MSDQVEAHNDQRHADHKPEDGIGQDQSEPGALEHQAYNGNFQQ